MSQCQKANNFQSQVFTTNSNSMHQVTSLFTLLSHKCDSSSCLPSSFQPKVYYMHAKNAVHADYAAYMFFHNLTASIS